MTTWADIEAELQALKAKVPQLKAEYGDDALQAFAELCDPILERADLASPDIWHSASVMSTDILIDAGLVDESERQH